MIVKGKTPHGFEFEIDSDVIRDMEVIDALAELDTNPLSISLLSKRILGDQRKDLYDLIRDKDGRVPDDVFGDEFAFILEAIGSAGKEEKN
jgi:hypothetical protein